MYIGHARLSVCLSVAACPHYCTDQDETWGNGKRCPPVVHYRRICNRCTGFVAMTTQRECEMSECSMPGLNCNISDYICPSYHRLLEVTSSIWLSRGNSKPYQMKTRMWANAQRDGRPVEYGWRPLFNAVKFG